MLSFFLATDLSFVITYQQHFWNSIWLFLKQLNLISGLKNREKA